MAEFPLVMNAGDFQLEKIAPTFENARTVFTLIDGQREYLAQWLNWVKFVWILKTSHLKRWPGVRDTHAKGCCVNL